MRAKKARRRRITGGAKWRRGRPPASGNCERIGGRPRSRSSLPIARTPGKLAITEGITQLFCHGTGPGKDCASGWERVLWPKRTHRKRSHLSWTASGVPMMASPPANGPRPMGSTFRCSKPTSPSPQEERLRQNDRILNEALALQAALAHSRARTHPPQQ